MPELIFSVDNASLLRLLDTLQTLAIEFRLRQPVSTCYLVVLCVRVDFKNGSAFSPRYVVICTVTQTEYERTLRRLCDWHVLSAQSFLSSFVVPLLSARSNAVLCSSSISRRNQSDTTRLTDYSSCLCSKQVFCGESKQHAHCYCYVLCSRRRTQQAALRMNDGIQFVGR